MEQVPELIHAIPVNHSDELCPHCGANLRVWLEMLGEVHYCDPEWRRNDTRNIREETQEPGG